MKASKLRLSFHKASGQACVVIDRKRVYLGKWPDGPDGPVPPEVEAKYKQVLAQAILGEPVTKPTKPGAGELLVSEAAAAWLTWAHKRYQGSSTPGTLQWAIAPLLKLFGPEPLSSVGPLRVAQAQKYMAANGLTRQGVIKATGFVRQFFAWCVAQELCHPDQLARIRAMQSLRRGAIDAAEKPPLEMAPLEDVQAALVELSPTVQAMVRVQMLTGMRPAEVCSLSMGEIDRVSPGRWVYKPGHHKMAHIGRVRQIPLLPDAIQVLLPFVRMDGKPLFSPADAREAWEIAKRANRKSKVQPSQVDRHRPDPETSPGDQYRSDSYRKAITRACKRAGVPAWSPNGLRKLAAQTVADAIGLEAARSLLGHADESVTRHHYARLELEAATVAATTLSSKLGTI